MNYQYMQWHNWIQKYFVKLKKPYTKQYMFHCSTYMNYRKDKNKVLNNRSQLSASRGLVRDDWQQQGGLRNHWGDGNVHIIIILLYDYIFFKKTTLSSTLAWKIPWMKELGGLQSMGSLRVRLDWATSLSLFTFMHWRRKWQPAPVFLPGESQGQRSLVGCCLGLHRVRYDWNDLAAAAAIKLCI